jgi:hypothetical protein
MIKPILTGVWVCVVTMGAAYVGATWQKPSASAAVTDPHDRQASGDLAPIRTRMISVPIVADGGIRGYVVAQFAFIASAKLIKHMPIKPDLYVVDEAFQLIFSGEMVDFRQFKKQDLPALGRKIAENVNKRLGQQVVSKDSVRGGSK